MKIQHHFPTRTPFGIQETFITDSGQIKLWGSDKDGYRWRFTSVYQFPTSDQKKYYKRPDAFEAAASFVNES